MNRRILRNARIAIAIALLALLAACSGGGPLVKPGPNQAGSNLTIDSPIEWTRFSAMRQQLWTIDGPLLNSLHLIPQVRPNEFIFLGRRQTTYRPDGAFYKPGMRPDEIGELIADGMRAAGAVNVQVRNLRPASFGGREGIRFEMSLANEEGLKYEAQAAAFEHERGLALALFYAPGEYYYPRDAETVSRMLDTLRWGR